MVACIVTLSGGMDSTTLLYDMAQQWGARNLSALSFNYGQRHRKEIEYALASCRKLSVQHHVVDLRSVNELISTSALTDLDIDVPEGHYADETMAITVVPNRNAMMLNIAIAHAVATQAVELATAIHAGDHAVYPDCRPDFISQLNKLAHVACEGFINPKFEVTAPYVNITKAEIATLGNELKVDWNDTWSCYKGGETHCGRCSTCLERIEAFSIANLEDPTPYVDKTLYNELVAAGKLQ